jgi:uncharacterized protein (DUF433 family)
MIPMNLPDFLTRDGDGDIRVTGLRIGLYHVLYYYNEGYSAEMLVGQFPDLSLALIHKIIAFYLENRQEVDAYLAAYQEDLTQQRNANPRRVPSIVELRRRLEEMQRAKES